MADALNGEEKNQSMQTDREKMSRSRTEGSMVYTKAVKGEKGRELKRQDNGNGTWRQTNGVVVAKCKREIAIH